MFATKTKWLPQWVWGGMCIVVRHGAAGVLRGTAGRWALSGAVLALCSQIGSRSSVRPRDFNLILFFPSPSSPNANFSFTDLTPSIPQLLDPFAELLALLSFAVWGVE